MATRKKRALLAPLIIITIIAALVIITLTGKKDAAGLATCLAEEGYVMAGAESCGYCQSQKSLFKGAFEEFIIPAGAYLDCDRDPEACTEAGIIGYPTWITPEGYTITGMQPLKRLASISGCTY
ncbi:hypothetical protein JXA12_01200 [Candidatus Woesearchaeota archaeon]|nr:hypothetical protein [Candidatus Woesearchaeota archaeon]